MNWVGEHKVEWLKIGQEGMEETQQLITSANCMSVEVSGIE